MGFNIINMNTWDRKDCFNHFLNNAKCTYIYVKIIQRQELASYKN